eukprot:1152698-Pelagomonas_calceolata.AAC.1
MDTPKPTHATPSAGGTSSHPRPSRGVLASNNAKCINQKGLELWPFSKATTLSWHELLHELVSAARDSYKNQEAIGARCDWLVLTCVSGSCKVSSPF